MKNNNMKNTEEEYENPENSLDVEDDDFYIQAKKRKPQIKAGTHEAVIKDITLVKNVETNYGGTPKVVDMYYVEFAVDGSTVKKRYTKTVENEKSNLFKLIKGLTGIDPRDGYAVKQLIGKECLITVVHNEDKRGNIWANISAVMPVPAK